MALTQVEPFHVAAYVQTMKQSVALPTVKQHLAALRRLFDWLVIGQVLAMNPVHAVRALLGRAGGKGQEPRETRRIENCIGLRSWFLQ